VTLNGEVTYPYIVVNDVPGIIERSYTFPFQKETIVIQANVSDAVYYGAENGIKYAVAPKGSNISLLAAGYYNAFISDPRQDAFYKGLLQNLRVIRSRYNLTDDEYFELMTDFVQSFPYDQNSVVHPDTPPRFPVETFVDGTGNCQDKSVLLAGLLSREGYDVVLFLFIPESHMALGIRNSSLEFQDTGYMYVETTGRLLPGEVPSGLAVVEDNGRRVNVTVVNSTPIIIRVGNGTKGYTSADEIADILAARKDIDSRIPPLQSQMGNCTVGSTSCNQTVELEYDTYATLHNYLVTHSYDRPGLYGYLIREGIIPAPAPSPTVQGIFTGNQTTNHSILSPAPAVGCSTGWFSFPDLWEVHRHSDNLTIYNNSWLFG
jgi:hypothetical protein